MVIRGQVPLCQLQYESRGKAKCIPSHIRANYCNKNPIQLPIRCNGEASLGKREHTSVFNAKFCLYGTYIGPCITASIASSADHSYCALLLPIVLPHSMSSSIYPTVRPHLSDTGRWMADAEGKDGCKRLGTKEPLHCAPYVLLPCSRSPNNVLHSPNVID